MMAFAFVKASQVDEGDSKGKQAEAGPEKGIRYYGDYYQIYKPKGCGCDIGDPEKSAVDVIDFYVWVCWLKDPFLLPRILIQLNPPSQSSKLFAVDIFIDPEINRNQEGDKDKVQEFKIGEDEIPFSIRVKNYKVMTMAFPNTKIPICLKSMDCEILGPDDYLSADVLVI